jgi:hypothetical protein
MVSPERGKWQVRAPVEIKQIREYADPIEPILLPQPGSISPTILNVATNNDAGNGR